MYAALARPLPHPLRAFDRTSKTCLDLDQTDGAGDGNRTRMASLEDR
jgi:hypothetical protein